MMAGDESESITRAAEDCPSSSTNMNDEDTIKKNTSLRRSEMELNVALECLEAMRRANLYFEFSTCDRAVTVDHERCTFCQRDQVNQAASNVNVNVNVTAASQDAGQIPLETTAASGRGGRLRDIKLDGHRIRSLDGRRIRSFSKRFLPKSAASIEADSCHEGHVNGNGNAADQLDTQTSDNVHGKHKLRSTESCPPTLENQLPPQTHQTYTQSSSVLASLEITTSANKLATTTTAATATTTSSENDTTETKPRKPILRRVHRACLTCGHPTCKMHISNTFSTHHIHICQHCAYLFELDFLVDVIAQATQQQNLHDENHIVITNNNNMQQCQQRVNEIIDCYDRAKLLLTYTSQYADDIATGLQSRTAKSNKIGVGANASGIVSGITGIVGAGALLFPPAAAAGVPILIAALVFGGGATAAHTGDYAAVKYWSEPNMLADKMVLLHGMCLSLLRVVEVLNFELANRLGHHDRNITQENSAERENGHGNGSMNSGETRARDERQMLAKDIRSLLEKHGVNTKLGTHAIAASTNITGTNVACRHSRFLGRVGATAANSFRFVPLAGGVLSAASLVVEANEIKKTLARMNEGNPCEKSSQILEIRDEVAKLPDASLIAGECRRVLDEANRERKMQEAERAKIETISSALTSLDNAEFESVVTKEMAAAHIYVSECGSVNENNVQ